MKKIILFFVLLFLINCATKSVVNKNEISINSKTTTKAASNFELKIEKIYSDSRCPLDVDCIRAGNVELQIGIYQNKKLEKSELLTIDSRNFEQNKAFLKSYISKNKTIKSIYILPTKRQDKNIEFEDYILKVELE